MVRENLINSAVNLLQHPSIAASTLEEKIAFLRSKHLTQEEIDISLAQTERGSSATNVPHIIPAGQPNYGYPNPYVVPQPPYHPYQESPWSPSSELSRRDWRDWFIMATVSTGISYGLYVAAKRYILPLILPPTPPQLVSDKASIDESFSRAFALIDQLAADTATLKSSEVERTEKLDTCLQDVETLISDLKATNLKRETESKILGAQVHGLRELVPKALDSWRAAGDARLEDLGTELRSLKKLIGHRINSGPESQPPLSRTFPSPSPKDKPNPNPTAQKPRDLQDHLPGSPAPAPGLPTAEQDPPPPPATTYHQTKSTPPMWPSAAANKKAIGDASSKGDGPLAERDLPSRTPNRNRVSIPAWQMAASANGKSGGETAAELKGEDGMVEGGA